jgi:HAE1 family hydrophobic/amphiphilic exporter-1
VSLPAFGVRKPVVVNLVMFTIIAAGIVFGLGLRKEFFPEIRPTMVMITAPYPGASPEEIEDALAIKIEDRLAELDDVVEITSTIAEGLCSVMVEFSEGVNIADAVFDVKNEVDALQDLPEEADRITVAKFEPNFPTINVSLFGDADERVMKSAIRQIRDDLRRIPRMGMIAESGVRTDAITVEVDPDAMLEHGLSIPRISDRVRAGMIELPGGAVKSTTANVAVRTMGAEERADEVREIVVKAGAGGQVVRVGDVAEVREGFEDVDYITRLNGKPAYSLTVYKEGKQDAVEMAAAVKAYVAGRTGEPIELTLVERVRQALSRPGTPPGDVSTRLLAYELGASRTDELPGELTTTTDLARFIVGRLELLSRNALWGGTLVLLTLVLLLNLRVAFWVAIGLVVSLLATLAGMHFMGASLNLLSMFGLIIVLGLLVDDAIVVAENITARHERGEPALDAAVNGTHQVGWPVVATVLTTICAFMPLTLIEGQVGDLLEVLPLVVTIALSVSLIECLFILPSHMGHSLIKVDRARRRAHPSPLARFEKRLDRAREGFFRRALIPTYIRSLEWCVRRRYLTITAAVSMVVVSVGLVAGGRVPFVFIPSSDAETVNVMLRMPVGTPIERTSPVAERIERAAMAQPEVSAAWTIIGSSGSLDGQSSAAGSHLAQLILELKPIEERDRSSQQVIVGIQGELGELSGVKSLRIEEMGGGPEGPPISLAVLGDDLGRLRAAANRIKGVLAEYDGVYNISDDLDVGRREIRLRLREGADELGLTTEDIARQVRGAVYGLEAHTFPGDREDVDVRVMLPRDVRRNLAAIERQFVFTPMGDPIPLREVVEIEETEGYATLKRLDRERVVTVSGYVNEATQNANAVIAAIQPELGRIRAEFPGVRITERGQQKEVQESMATLPLGMLAAAGLIFVVLTWLFSSYAQPVIVLMAIPFASIGMIWGHFLLGYDIALLSLIGFIALSGVVVNDSLIFMQFFNEKRSEGLAVDRAAVEAGRARMRAILLTTVTTVLGLLPLMLEKSFQARFLIPMAITISFGLMSATAIILVVLPCLLVIMDDAKRAVRWAWSGGAGRAGADQPGGVEPV